MLLETIRVHDRNSIIKLVSIDVLRSQGKNLSQIHSVPALILNENTSSKEILFGKEVFDFLLLPKEGFLVKSQNSLATSSPSNSDSIKDCNNSSEAEAEPLAFTIGSTYSDGFCEIEDNNIPDNGYSDRMYSWTLITENKDELKENKAYNEDTRTKKEIPDIAILRQQRDLEIKQQNQNDLKSSHLNLASIPTR